jgi:hypothetical protein
LSEDDLLNEWDIHRFEKNRQRTALVSVTNRPLEALNRALKKYYNSHENPGTIWIVIIRVPDGRNSIRPHHVQRLAQRLAQRRDDPADDVVKYKYEYVFEWEIPQEYVVHCVSLRTLIHRGIERMLRLQYYPQGFPSFKKMRDDLLKNNILANPSGTEFWLCSLAQAFGARAYTYEIALRTLHNCLSGGYIDEDNQYVYFNWADFCGSLEFSDIRDIEIGIQRTDRLVYKGYRRGKKIEKVEDGMRASCYNNPTCPTTE